MTPVKSVSPRKTDLGINNDDLHLITPHAKQLLQIQIHLVH